MFDKRCTWLRQPDYAAIRAKEDTAPYPQRLDLGERQELVARVQ